MYGEINVLEKKISDGGCGKIASRTSSVRFALTWNSKPKNNRKTA
jgi:hypothetical protein